MGDLPLTVNGTFVLSTHDYLVNGISRINFHKTVTGTALGAYTGSFTVDIYVIHGVGYVLCFHETGVVPSVANAGIIYPQVIPEELHSRRDQHVIALGVNNGSWVTLHLLVKGILSGTPGDVEFYVGPGFGSFSASGNILLPRQSIMVTRICDD
jgi:hypothetical protein